MVMWRRRLLSGNVGSCKSYKTSIKQSSAAVTSSLFCATFCTQSKKRNAVKSVKVISKLKGSNYSGNSKAKCMHESRFLFKTKAKANCIMSLGCPSIFPIVPQRLRLKPYAHPVWHLSNGCTIGANIDWIDLNLENSGHNNLMPYKKAWRLLWLLVETHSVFGQKLLAGWQTNDVINSMNIVIHKQDNHIFPMDNFLIQAAFPLVRASLFLDWIIYYLFSIAFAGVSRAQ